MVRNAEFVVEPSVDQQEAYWNSRWELQEVPNNWQKRRADTMTAMLRDLQLDRPSILDLGCATGWMSRMLSEFGLVEGVDLSEVAIAQAKSQFPEICFTAGDLYEIDLVRTPVDVVVCQEVIAHVTDQPLLVKRIAEALKPRGYLLISAANRFVMDRVRDSDKIVGVGAEDPTEHIKKWLSMREMKSLIAPYFEVLNSTSVIPMGNRGCLRFINSYKLNSVASHLIPQKRLELLKERLGLGYSIIAVGRKRT